MPLDADAEALVKAMQAVGPPLWELTPAEARARMAAIPRPANPETVGSIEDLRVSADGLQIPIRIYRPDGGGRWPILVLLHGGGWVVGSIESQDPTSRALCNAGRCAVVAVEYRLAPEHPFPAAVDDCYAVTCWVAREAARLGLDGSRIAVGGDSAGGNLAAAVAQRVRDQGGPSLALQLLIYPVTGFDRDTASMRRNADGRVLTRDGMIWFDGHYLRAPEDRRHPYAAPLRARDFSGLAPALVITAEFDPLCDEGEAYAARLAQAGVPTRLSRYDGVFHGFFGMKGMVAKADVAHREAAAALRRAFGEGDG
jgi:acetyl esterase